MDDEPEVDPDVARVRNAAAALGEHFDSVQIIVTKHADGATSSSYSGKGNWYARMGSVREWLMRTDERAKESIRHEADEDDD